MPRFRRRSRGLAEIVGTLMLVVIVVAAATAFSFFVAAYQKQVQAQETLSHDRALEKVKVLGVSEVACSAGGIQCALSSSTNYESGSFANVSFLVTNLDVNRISFTGLILNSLAVVNYSVQHADGTVLTPCFSWNNTTKGVPDSGEVPCKPVSLAPYSTLTIFLNLDEELPDSKATLPYAFGVPFDGLTPASDLNFQILTSLDNLFTEKFSPPAAIISVFFVSTGTSTVPVFDGLSSYQSPGSDNASILGYFWSTTPSTACGSPSGPEFECSSLAAPGPYTVTLDVTNTDGLSGETEITYTPPS